PGDEGALFAAAISPDGRKLAVGGAPFGSGRFGIMIHIVSLDSGEVLKVLRGHLNIVTSLAFTRDGRYVASSSGDKLATLWDIESGAPVRLLQGHPDRLRLIVLSPANRFAATVCHDGKARIWLLDDGRKPAGGKPVVDSRPLAELPGVDGDIWVAAWSPDSQTLATGNRAAMIRLYDTTG